MKNIKFFIFLLALSSCNQYFGTVDQDYVPKNEVSEIFSDLSNDNFMSEVEFGHIIYPKFVNHSLNIKNLEIEKIIKTNNNSIVHFVNEKIIVSKNKNIYLIDKLNKKNITKYKINLKKDENVIHFFDYNGKVYLITNNSRIFNINEDNLSLISDYGIYINIAPIIIKDNLIILSVFGDIYKVNLLKQSIIKSSSFDHKLGINIKSNIFEDEVNYYYLFNTSTLITFNKQNTEFFENYILEDLNILSSLGTFSELIDTPFNYNGYLYFLDRSGKIAVFNQYSSEILWEFDIKTNILSYLFSKNGNLIILTTEKILIIASNGDIINSYKHNKDLPISIFSISENIYLISKDGIITINLNKKLEELLFKNKFTSNLDIFYQDNKIYLKDDLSLIKISE